MSHSVQVRVQGRDYNLRTQQTSEQVQKVAAFLEEQLESIPRSGSVDSQDALALTLLNLAGKYLQLRESGADQLQEERLLNLIQKLESGLDSPDV